MATDVKQIKLFISSPSDIVEERKSIDDIIEDLNHTICLPLTLQMISIKWEKDIYPAVGKDPQDVINSQAIGYDIFIGIMWNKYGTPTSNADSGTEEEFNLAYDNFSKKRECKTIMFFFNKQDIPYDSDIEQLSKVRKFKKSLTPKGVLYKEYNGSSDFEKVFRTALTKYITDTYPAPDLTSSELKENAINQITTLSDKIITLLNNIEISFTHPKIDNIAFDDIYVPQNLKDLSKISSNTYKTKNLENLTNAIESRGIYYQIIGAEASGKTAACKYMFKRYFQLNLYPILLNGMDLSDNVRVDNIIRITNIKLEEQYQFISKKIQQNKSDNFDFILIIDDFQKSAKGKEKYWNLLISNLKSIFLNIIVVGDIDISTSELTANPPFENFDKYSILEFGPKLRNILVNKWYSLGSDTSLEDHNEILIKNDEAIKQINAILGKNYIPSYPFYILGILQTLEVGTIGSTNYSLHGFYYEFLINESFKSCVKDPKEISFYYNFLTSFCYHLFMDSIRVISIDDFEDIISDYCNKHDVDKSSFSIKKVKETFKNSKLLSFNHNVTVSQNYIYYFFVAKYLANYIDRPEIKNIIKKLSNRIFRDEYANIIMFVTHLSKNEWIINTLLENATEIFKDFEEAKLENDIDGINDLIQSLPKQIVDEIDVDKERNKQLELDEELEKKQKEFDQDEMNYSQISLDDDISKVDIIAKINLAMKTIDILGQITKKYWGELDADIKYSMVQATYSVGLRTLGMYLNMISENKKEIAEYIKNLVAEKYMRDKMKNWEVRLDKENAERISHHILVGLCYFSSWGIIKRISNAVGYDKLKITFDKILEKNPYNSYKLTNLSINLNYNKFPLSTIEEYSKNLKDKNNMCYRLLQDLVINYMYMFEVDYKKLNQISKLLEIKVKTQRYIQNFSKNRRI